MTITISRDLFSAFLTCKYKAHLLHEHCMPILSEFSHFSESQDADFQSAARERLLASTTTTCRAVTRARSMASSVSGEVPMTPQRRSTDTPAVPARAIWKAI